MHVCETVNNVRLRFFELLTGTACFLLLGKASRCVSKYTAHKTNLD